MNTLRKYRVAVVQMDTCNDKERNLELACQYIDEAAKEGAKLVSFPEMMNLIGKNVGAGGNYEDIPGFTTDILMKKAKECSLYIHGGSILERIEGENQAYNTSVMISPMGEIKAKYRKLHTFDITLPDGTVCNESAKVRQGNQIVTIDTELGKFGMSVCYDIRFPELYRMMAMEGAEVMFAPASFTMPTGKDHWETILRTRAIENGCYMVAADQIGQKSRYVAYGNSMVVDPWGTVIARARDEAGVIYAEIDLDYVDRVRQKLPSLKNRRADIYELKKTE